ncbi:MAG: hypothetical protein PVG92_09055 [Holophagae bacterium]
MALDFETVRILRWVFALIGAAAGSAFGLDHYQIFGAIGGALAGGLLGWNLVDMFKGRAQK